MSTESREKLYYDGQCPLCNAFVSHVNTEEATSSFIDANTASELPAAREAILDSIHLVLPDGTIRTGPDAILTTLAKKHPWLSPVAAMMRYPGFSHIAEVSYRFIAQRRTWWFGNDTSRVFWLFLILCLGFLSSLALTTPLWGTERTYPLAPTLEHFQSFHAVTPILFGILIGSLVLGLCSRRYIPHLALAGAVSILLLINLDITRLQPWVWQYGVLLTLLAFWKPHDHTRSTELLDAARFVVVGIYFWSGVQKFNIAFFSEVFPWFTKPLWQPFGDIGVTVALSVGLLIPFIEAGFALGFLTRRFRTVSLYGATAMLTLVISCLVFGHGWNSSVWPWNFVMIFMAIALFWRSSDSFTEIMRRSLRNRFAHVTIGLFLVLPAGNLLNLSDHYLSWSLYSGHVPTAELTAPTEFLRHLSPSSTLENTNGTISTLPIITFSMDTMNVVPYPEERVFRQLLASLCRSNSEVSPLELTITTRHFFLSQRKTERSYQCSDIPKE